MSKPGYTYILTNKTNSTLYIGVTSILKKRVWDHKNKLVQGFTNKYNINKLVYYEVFDSIAEAIKREKYLKGKKRSYKIALINKENVDFIDLYDQIL